MKNKALTIIVAASGCWFGMASAAMVARVSLSVGEVTLIRPDGTTAKLLRGAEVSEQDRIVTGKDGMAMLIFVDQGRVALRPDSELLIRKYADDPTGLATQLQLDLARGTVRQISGRAAQRQPDRYRLNTPIAAIGVRGTDFLAKATSASVQTYVHEGAITLQPMQMGQSMGAQTLGEAGQSHYLQARAEGALELQQVQAEEAARLFGIRLGRPAVVTAQQTTATATATDSSLRADAPLLAQASTVTRGNWLQTTDAGAASALDSGTLQESLGTQRPAVSPQPVQPTSPPEPLPPAVVVPLPTQLVWGKFRNADQLPLTLPVTYEEASAGRKVTVGQIGAYALWREGAGPSSTLRGTADFAMAAGEGYYSAGGQNTVLSLSQPQLQVNFDNKTFNTQLGMNGDGVPAAQLSVSGKVDTEGMFLGRTTDQRVAGALNALGNQAGYLFQINAATGTYNGITLWTQK